MNENYFQKIINELEFFDNELYLALFELSISKDLDDCIALLMRFNIKIASCKQIKADYELERFFELQNKFINLLRLLNKHQRSTS